MVKVTVSLPALPGLAEATQAGLTALGADVVEALAADPFNIGKWAYRGRKRRPSYSPAMSEWVAKVEASGLSVVNRAENRRGVPYVGWIHYAGTPRSDTVVSRVQRDMVPGWVAQGAEKIGETFVKRWNRG